MDVPTRQPSQQEPSRRYVIIGGGIAGVTAAEELLNLVEAAGNEEEDSEVTLLTATRTVKQVGRVVQVTRKLEEVDVVERDANEFARGRRHLRIVQARVTGVDAQAHLVRCQGACGCLGGGGGEGL
jgi:NADH dehydrogenase FAD-containing subunit